MGGFLFKSKDALLPRRLLNTGDWWHQSWHLQLDFPRDHGHHLLNTQGGTQRTPWTPQPWALLQSKLWAVEVPIPPFAAEERAAQRHKRIQHRWSWERILHLSPLPVRLLGQSYGCGWKAGTCWRMLNIIWPEWSIERIAFKWITRGIWLRKSAGDMPCISHHVGHWKKHLWQWLEGKKWNSACTTMYI